MRIALISDIHANAQALAQLDDIWGTVDRIVCLGDVIGYYCEVNEVIDAVRAMDAICIRGNHDDFLLNGCPADLPPAVRFGIDYADRVIRSDNRAWLESLPLIWEGELGGKSFLLAHGSPWNPLTDYLYADHPRLSDLKSINADVVAVGQTHRRLIRVDSRPWLINPGSVGQSRDRMAVACAVRIDLATGNVECIDRPFDPQPVIQLAQSQGSGDWINKHLVPL